ncbi:SOS response-associated peptidase [uncultured Robinsoniella sp.]|uniref:SOS response-associated peptidase n=1 Tax=uncultured Robinsoniella sp. TaxID=904190 RepID=UPI00374E25C8
MCGRYYVDDDTIREIEKIVRHVEENLCRESGTGDIFPTSRAPVIVGKEAEFAEELFGWGFPGFDKKGVIFNARAETALEKRMFRDSILVRRCVVPARHFYEWDAHKNKYTFHREDGKILFLAGFYNLYDGQERFVILTTDANETMMSVHNRMPLILEREEIGDWIFDDFRAKEILHQVPARLKGSSEYVQQTLDFG